MIRILFIVVCAILSLPSYGQILLIDGYAYESGNRGFLDVVNIIVRDEGGTFLAMAYSDNTGNFKVEVPMKEMYKITATKEMFESLELEVEAKDKKDGDKIFPRIQMERAPGYQFEVTLAEKRSSPDQVVDAIRGARIDIYNNTTRKEVDVLYDLAEPQFITPLIKGNHYTILIRKTGFLNKRIEAFVDVEGCILCFEGLGSVGPGVSDNLSRANQIGVLLANVEMERLFTGKTMEINNIYYQLGKANIDKSGKNGLKTLAILMNDNPEISVEIGSHTDSRGSDEMNMDLSKRRAANVVDYLIRNGIDPERLISRGYGELNLVNECSNNVRCSEEDHRKNRRTELKVIGINENGIAWRSLADMKRSEYGEELLEEIQFGGQVMVAEGEEEMTNETLDSLSSMVEEAPSEVKAKTPEALAESLDKLKKEPAVEVAKETIETVANTEKDLTEMPDKIEPDQMEENQEAVKADVEIIEIKKEYLIVIHEASAALPKDAELRNRHTNLIEYKDLESGTFFYMLGGEDSVESLKKLYGTTVKLAYPDSYLVQFYNGKITKI